MILLSVLIHVTHFTNYKLFHKEYLNGMGQAINTFSVISLKSTDMIKLAHLQAIVCTGMKQQQLSHS